MKNQDDPYLKNAIKRILSTPDQVGIIYHKKYIYIYIWLSWGLLGPHDNFYLYNLKHKGVLMKLAIVKV